MVELVVSNLFKNFRNYRNKRNRPIIVRIRFKTLFKNWSYFGRFPFVWIYSRVNRIWIWLRLRLRFSIFVTTKSEALLRLQLRSPVKPALKVMGWDTKNEGLYHTYLFDGPPARTMIRSKYVPPGGMPIQDSFARVSSVNSGRSSHASFERKTYTKNCSGMLLIAFVSVGLAKSSIIAATP